MFDLNQELNRKRILDVLEKYSREIMEAEAFVRVSVHSTLVWIHTIGVRDFALELSVRECQDSNPFVLVMAALFHDVTKDTVPFEDHARTAADKFREFLMSDRMASMFQFESVYGTEVIHCIETHVSAWAESGPKPETLEAKIISDADMMQQLGPFGVVKHMEKHSKLPFFDRLRETERDLEQAFKVLQTNSGRELGALRIQELRRFLQDACNGR